MGWGIDVRPTSKRFPNQGRKDRTFDPLLIQGQCTVDTARGFRCSYDFMYVNDVFVYNEIKHIDKETLYELNNYILENHSCQITEMRKKFSVVVSEFRDTRIKSRIEYRHLIIHLFYHFYHCQYDLELI